MNSIKIFFTVFLLVISAVGRQSYASAQSAIKVVTPVTVTVEKTPLASGKASRINMVVPGTKDTIKIAVTPGNAVRITGTSVQLGDSKTVKIDITKPDGSKVSVNAQLTSQGTFDVSFKDTKIAGIYKVTANSPDGKSSAKTSFLVINATYILELSKVYKQPTEQLAAKTGKIVNEAKAIIKDCGDFPGRGKMNENIEQIDKALAGLPKQMANVNKALDQLSGLIKEYPGLANVQELADMALALGEEKEKMEDLAHQADDLLSRIPKSKGMSICDRMDDAIAALTLAGVAFEIYTTGPTKIAKILISLAVPAAINKMYETAVPFEQRNSTKKTAFTSGMQSAATMLKDGADGVKEYAKIPVNLAHDAVGYLIGSGFENLCERFTGPIEGVFSVDAKDAGGRKFWSYKIQIQGRLILRYEKKNNTGKAPVPLTGRFEGIATKIDAWEDYLGRLNELNTVLFHCVVLPVVTPEKINWATETLLGPMASAMLLPNYFLIPVTGALATDGNSLTIKVAEKGIKDFKEGLCAYAYYASMPRGSFIPIVQKFDIPMENAQFILSRGLRSPATVKVKTEKLPKGTLVKTIAETFTRTEVVSNGEVTVKWELKVKACNPACP